MAKLHSLNANSDIVTNGEVVPSTDESLTKVIATIGGVEIKAPEGGGGGGLAGYTLTISVTDNGGSGPEVTQKIICVHSDMTREKIQMTGGTRTVDDVAIVFVFSTSDNGGECASIVTIDGNECGATINSSGGVSTFASYLLEKNTTVSIYYSRSCFLRGTPITLADGSHRPCEDITYDDDLLVWDFDNGRFASAKPLYIRKPMTADKYWINRFADGREVRTTGTVAGHRFFSVDDGKFLYNTECVGRRVFMEDGSESVLVEAKLVEEPCEYYNIVTSHHLNCFIGGVLGSCRLNNMYMVDNMRFVADERVLRPRFAYPDIDADLYYGLRLAEQTGSIDELRDYVMNRICKFAKER